MHAQPWRFFFFWAGEFMPIAAPLTPYTKPALPFADQVSLLQQRGLMIADPLAAEQTLASISYYRLSAYCYPFRQRDTAGVPLSQFEAGATFESVLALYEFDRALRLLVMDALERVEVAVRTRVTHQLGMAHGPFGHEAPANFHPQFKHDQWILKLRDDTRRSRDAAFVAHFQTNYAGYPALPIWMTTELISMGSLSFLYKGMLGADKRVVADAFKLHPKRLQDWLHVLTYVRNVCAHHSRLWNRELSIQPQAMPEPEWNAPLMPRLDRVFCILLMLRYLLDQSGNGLAWRDACNALLLPVTANPRWRKGMGMPVNWENHPCWM
jgi:abortive infection bacteriophage resistance protein